MWGGIREKDKERDTETQTNEIVQPESGPGSMRRSGLLAGCVYGQTVEKSQGMSVPVLRGSQCSLLRCEITKAP